MVSSKRGVHSSMRYFLSLILLLGFCFLTDAASAQGENLEIEAKLGFDGFYRPGDWAPVFVTVANRPGSGQGLGDVEDFVGQLMLVSSPRDTDGSAIRFIRPIDVPRASNKRYLLLVKIAEDLNVSETPTLSLNAANGKLLRTIPLDMNHVLKENLLVVNVSDTFSPPAFPRLRNNLDSFVTARLSPTWVPDSWAAFDSVDVLVFPAWPDNGLAPDQLKALRQWVALGGTLVFLTGRETGTYADQDARDFLPVVMDGTIRLDETDTGFVVTRSSIIPAEGRTSHLIADAATKADAETLLELEGHPIVARQRLGEGQIVFFANDLQATAPRLEKYLGGAWLAIAPLPNLAGFQYEFTEALKGGLKVLSGRAARPPNQFLIILICILYTIIVGPVNFTILARKKKLEWAWLTLPAIVLVFFFLIYGLGRLTKSGESILREIAVETYRSGGTEGAGLTVCGTFVSSPGKYFFQPTGQDQALSEAFDWNTNDALRGDRFGMNFNIGQPPPTVVGGSSPVVGYEPASNSVTISSWDMGVYEAATFLKKGPVSMQGSVDGDLAWSGSSVGGSIVNNSDRDFEDSWILIGGRIANLGEFRSGSRKEIPTGPGASPYRSLSAELDKFVVKSAMEDAELNDHNFSTVMRALSLPTITGGFAPTYSGGAYFIGRRDSVDTDATVSNLNPEVTSRVEITRVHLDVNPAPDADFLVEYGELVKRVHGHSLTPAGVFAMDDTSRLSISSSSGIFSFELPFQAPGAAVTTFEFNPKVVNELPTEDLLFEIFEHSPRARWVELTPNAVYQAANVTLPISGRMYMRVSSTRNQKVVQTGWNERTQIASFGLRVAGSVSSGAEGQ